MHSCGTRGNGQGFFWAMVFRGRHIGVSFPVCFFCLEVEFLFVAYVAFCFSPLPVCTYISIFFRRGIGMDWRLRSARQAGLGSLSLLCQLVIGVATCSYRPPFAMQGLSSSARTFGNTVRRYLDSMGQPHVLPLYHSSDRNKQCEDHWSRQIDTMIIDHR